MPKIEKWDEENKKRKIVKKKGIEKEYDLAPCGVKILPKQG